LLGALTLPHAARAQDVSASPDAGTPFDRRRTVSVSERVQPGYEERGYPLDGIMVFPRLRVIGAYEDNVRASATDRQSDVGFTLEPSVSALSDWSRHQIGLAASGSVTRFAKLDSESAETFNVRGEGRYDAGDQIRVFGYAAYRRDVERRSAPGALRDSRRPAAYNTATVGGRLTWQGTRLRLAASASTARIDYADITRLDGLVFNSRELDRKVNQGSLRADYAVTPNLAVLVTGTLGKIDYDLPPVSRTPDRSARKAELLAGLSFEFTDLLRGEVAIGYIDQDFRTASLTGFSGFGGRAELEYYPTRLTSVRFDASRTIQDAGNPLAPSYRRTRVGVRVDHELFRQVLLTAVADYESARFQLPFRTERRPHAALSGQYLVNRHLTLFARYDHLRATSRPALISRRFTDNIVSVGALLEP
jgi:hypothetical protein